MSIFSSVWWQNSLAGFSRGACFCWPLKENDTETTTENGSKGIIWLDNTNETTATATVSFSGDESSILFEQTRAEKSSKTENDISEEIHCGSPKEATFEWKRLPSISRASDVDTKKEKGAGIPDLPVTILVSMIAPFLSDRITLNRFSMTCKEVYQACQESVLPPWPSTMLNLRSRLWSVAFSPDNKTLAVGGTDGRIRLFDRRKGPTEVLTGHLGRVYSIVFTREGNTMMSLSGDGDLRIWSMNGGSESGSSEEEESPYSLQRQVPTHTTHSVCMAYNHEAQRLAAGGEGDIKFYSPNGIGVDVLTMERTRFLVECVAFSPNGQFMAAGTGGHMIHFWDLNLRECITTFHESSSVHALQYSPDGQYLVAGTDHRDIRVWNILTGDYITLTGHRDLVWSVAFSPDGRHIASASDDGTVRVWCAMSGLCTDILNGHAGSSVYSVAFSPDGTTIVSTSDDGFIELRRTRGVTH